MHLVMCALSIKDSVNHVTRVMQFLKAKTTLTSHWFPLKSQKPFSHRTFWLMIKKLCDQQENLHKIKVVSRYKSKIRLWKNYTAATNLHLHFWNCDHIFDILYMIWIWSALEQIVWQAKVKKKCFRLNRQIKHITVFYFKLLYKRPLKYGPKCLGFFHIILWLKLFEELMFP